MENTTNTQGTAKVAEKVKERTVTLTFKQIRALAENKEWLNAFEEILTAMPVLTAKQGIEYTKPKK